MTDQTIILILLLLATGATLWLYILKAKNEVVYKKDERWQAIQVKANQAANIANWILIVLLFIGTTIPIFSDTEIVFTLQRVTIFGVFFIGTRNLIELVAIQYFDKRL